MRAEYFLVSRVSLYWCLYNFRVCYICVTEVCLFIYLTVSMSLFKSEIAISSLEVMFFHVAVSMKSSFYHSWTLFIKTVMNWTNRKNYFWNNFFELIIVARNSFNTEQQILIRFTFTVIMSNIKQNFYKCKVIFHARQKMKKYKYFKHNSVNLLKQNDLYMP